MISGECLPEATAYMVTFDEAIAESYPYISVLLYWVFWGYPGDPHTGPLPWVAL